MRLNPLPGPFGVEAPDVDLSNPLSDADFHDLERAFYANQVLALRAQAITAAQFMDFARRLGPPQPHVIDQFHHPEDPNILILSNVKKDGHPTGLQDAGSYFHTDYSYLDVPARCTMLYAIQMPREGSGTTFANQRQAYADLSSSMKERIEGLVCRHHYGNRENLDETSRTVASVLTEAEKQKITWVRHPLVRRHPHTGVPVLYAVSGSSFEIEGMPADAGRALLDELKAHSTQPKYCHTNYYAVGDVIVWDNCQLLHSAPVTDLTAARTLWRITVKDAGPTL